MNSKTTLSISQARSKIFDIAEDVQKPDKYYVLTENGRPKVVIMGADEFESWMETLEVMKDFPNLERDIEEARKQYKKGEYTTLDQMLAKEGYVLAEKPQKKYEVPSRRTKKGTKKSR